MPAPARPRCGPWSSNLSPAERTLAKAAGGLALALAALLLLAGPGLAHAGVATADPPGGVLVEAPPRVTLTFSEPVTPVGRGVAVWSPSGRQVATNLTQPGAAVLVAQVDARERGTYLVVWRVIASDTHPSRGSYTFSVGTAGPPPEVGGLPTGDVGAVSPLGLLLQVLGRWLHLGGYALAFGALAFAVFALGEAPGSPAERACRRLSVAGIVILVLAEPVMLVAQALSLGALDGQVVAAILASPSGRILALRLGAALLLWALLGAALESRRRVAWIGCLALGVALAFVDAAASHGTRAIPAALGLVLNAAHELAMAGWLGGFAALVAVLRLAAAADRRPLLARFGRLAAVSTAVLVLTGALLAIAHLRSPLDLLTSTYGVVVAIKVVGVAGALLAAFLGLRAGRSWRAEAAGMAGVLALAGLLVSLPPPR